ncbi:MAG: CTP synthase, partial [Halanaerobiales bacterium]
TQHSIKELRGIGIQHDAVVCRADRELTQEVMDKIALFGDIEEEAVIEAVDADHIYEVPLSFEEENLADIVLEKFKLEDEVHPPDLEDWRKMVRKMKNLTGEVTIAIVGKYVELPDAYISINEALNHAGVINDCDVNIEYIYAEDLEEDCDPAEILAGADGVLVPGGFGDRGIEGKIRAIKYVRENNIPYFGICLGMQCAVIEFSRSKLGFEGANSSEFDLDTPYPVIDLMPEQKDIEDKGGTMRLGLYPCKLQEGSVSSGAYQEEVIYERHRHRYELNNQYRRQLKEAGMVMAGISPDEKLVEIIELKDHPWFVGVQFHPEFKSRPNRPHPLFASFITTVKKMKDSAS